MSLVDILTLVLSCTALLATAFIGRRERQLQGRVSALEIERHEKEAAAERRAEVRAYYQQREGTPAVIVIENAGPATARDIDFAPIRQGPRELHPVHGRVGLPIALLGPGDDKAFRSLPRSFWTLPCDIRVTWIDDTGPRERLTTLTL